MNHPDKEKSEKERPEHKPDEQKRPPEQQPQSHGLVQPMIDELLQRPQPADIEPPDPSGPGHPPQPAELDQDPGGGYNPDGTYPQT